MSVESSVRIGIDVGGTFTHAVAIESASLKLLGKTKVPTTHAAKEGVALGVISALRALLSETGIPAGKVAFIAHSTTQATNALLEGDVAAVGIIGMGGGASAWLARSATNPAKIELSSGKLLTTYHRFIDTSKPVDASELKKAFTDLKEQGAQAFAISEAFSVDDPGNEKKALAIAHEMGLLASAGSEISQLYGLSVRTRTAVLNASMLPKMLETANLTEQCVAQAGIKAPLMIMRSDGGVMDIASMRRRPILTMLSGPAAGVAAALMFLRISDGIFIEVGGTSTDISAVTSGRALVKSGEIGGNKLFMRTVDVRTVGVAGGSLPRLDQSKSKIIAAGPRSAHIAGLKYVAFSDELKNPVIELVAPAKGDPSDYATVGVEGNAAPQYCLTTTCAANLLELVPPSDCAFGNKETIKAGFDALAAVMGKPAMDCAEEFLSAAASKCEPIIEAFIRERKFDRQTITLYGGGGGAAALVPYLAKKMNVKFELAQSADVISAIGVGLALLRETVERQIVNPSNDDILRIRQEVEAAIGKMGAAPSSVQVFVEIDAQTNTVRATATGATSVTETAKTKSEVSQDEKLTLIASSLQVPSQSIHLAGQNDYFQAFTCQKMQTSLLGLVKTAITPIRVIDLTGTIRYQARHGEIVLSKLNGLDKAVFDLANKLSTWGDAGRSIPNIILFAGTKMVDLSGLMSIEQILSLAKVELENLPSESQVIVAATPT
jgi:N-methylhydantoinase A/oxoprolinase/acetone carboxylase beta subunit